MACILHTPDTIFSARHAPSWLLLTGGSGLVNGLAFLACAQYVTHVTGTATRLGLEWPHAGVAAEYAVVVLSFIIGAMTSVLALQARAYRGERPLWSLPLVAVAFILAGVALVGPTGTFGPFGGEATTAEPPVVLLSLLAFATGLQNAAVATVTGLAVRTTHLTGPATDLGVHLGVAYFATGEERRTALRGAALRGGKVIAFVVGAGLALPLAETSGYLAFLVPAVFALTAAGLSFTPEWGQPPLPSAAGKTRPRRQASTG
jgi:uncharacterized membrane protein YoaK (UPF0700 family)